jgi:hypothetical protein
MTASFAAILNLEPNHDDGGPAEIRDGLKVAKCLSGNENVLLALRAARKPRS